MSYNKVSEMCFTDCIHDFTSRKVAEGEVIIYNFNLYGYWSKKYSKFNELCFYLHSKFIVKYKCKYRHY